MSKYEGHTPGPYLLDRRRRGFDPGYTIGDLTRDVVAAADEAIAATKGGA